MLRPGCDYIGAVALAINDARMGKGGEEELSGVLTRADRLSDRLLAKGEDLGRKGRRIKAMLADGLIDDTELRDLVALASELLDAGEAVVDEGVEALDIGTDVVAMRQILTLGRAASPNRHLQDREKDVAWLKAERKKRRGATMLQIVTPDFDPGPHVAG